MLAQSKKDFDIDSRFDATHNLTRLTIKTTLIVRQRKNVTHTDCERNNLNQSLIHIELNQIVTIITELFNRFFNVIERLMRRALVKPTENAG